MWRPVVDLDIGPSGRPFYSVVVDVQMFPVPLIITSETYLDFFLGTVNMFNCSNLIIKKSNEVQAVFFSVRQAIFLRQKIHIFYLVD